MIGVVTPYSVAFTGLWFTVVSIHPIGMPGYMTSVARRSATGSMVAWIIGLITCAYAIYGTISHSRTVMWFVFPALCYWFFLTEPGKDRVVVADQQTKTDEPEGNNA